MPTPPPSTAAAGRWGEGERGGGTPVDDEPALVSFELVLEEDELPSHHSQAPSFRRLPTFLRKKTRAGAAVAAPPSEGPTTIEDKEVEEVEEEVVATPDDDDDGDDQEEEARFKLDDRTRRCDVVGAGDGFELSLGRRGTWLHPFHRRRTSRP